MKIRQAEASQLRDNSLLEEIFADLVHENWELWSISTSAEERERLHAELTAVLRLRDEIIERTYKISNS